MGREILIQRRSRGIKPIRDRRSVVVNDTAHFIGR
jgi:hypothetical protein